MISMSCLRAWTTRELERRSGTMSGRSAAGVPGAPAAGGGAVPGGGMDGGGGPGGPGVPGAAPTRPLAKSWARSWASSCASACLRAMICSSLSATSTSTRSSTPRSRRTLAAVSLRIRRFVSRCAARAPWAGTKGRSSVTASWTLMNRSGTIWVTISSGGRPSLTSRPTIVFTGVCGAPSRGMIRYRLPERTAARPLTSRIVSSTAKTSSLEILPTVCTVIFRPRAVGART